MSVRYGIDLVLQPSYTAKLYQARQILCGQYSSWAAEMQMLRMALTPFFPCADDRLSILASQIEEIARNTSTEKPYTLARTAIVADHSINGVVIEFQAPPPLFELQRNVLEAAQANSPGIDTPESFQPRIALLEYGAFPEAILPAAADFAAGVASGLDMTDMALPWRLLLTRYSSQAAGDDWSDGRWAADLSWQQLYSHPLYTEVASVFELLNSVGEQPGEEGGQRRGLGRLFGR